MREDVVDRELHGREREHRDGRPDQPGGGHDHGWSDPEPVLIDGKDPFGTFAASAGAGASAGQLVAGYEGKRARACLARFE